MVERQLVSRGIYDPRVLSAFRQVAREAFVPPEVAACAYQDSPLPIGLGQTISQPYIVALTCQALCLRGGERVLEVGTGSGYAAAVLSHLAQEVYTVERIGVLAEEARARLDRLGYGDVHVVEGDGILGLPAHAPYDAIAVAAGGPEIPGALLAQLRVGGRLVFPLGPHGECQVLTRVTRLGPDRVRREALADVRFVPLVDARDRSVPALCAPGPSES